ncbi:hypothetical protein [aff. Roholtiella sp. LEGE 12411]|nr:hypothetical protein [aff. Roholtiella sp. LEGE 12411]
MGAFQQALQLNPEYTEAYSKLGVACNFEFLPGN